MAHPLYSIAVELLFTLSVKSAHYTHAQVDWSPINGMVVSGGEDCKYKVGVW